MDIETLNGAVAVLLFNLRLGELSGQVKIINFDLEIKPDELMQVVNAYISEVEPPMLNYAEKWLRTNHNLRYKYQVN